MTIALQSSIVYGPIASRRFGLSLGINLLPCEQKVCTFKCGYCQYSSELSEGTIHLPLLQEIKAQIKNHFEKISASGICLDWITIAGNGEPTLYPRFQDAVKEILKQRDQFFGGVPVGILSNSSTCFRAEIKQALELLDGRFMKLDAGSEEMFVKMNRPCREDVWHEIIKGLSQLGSLTIQTMFVTGDVDNTGDRDVEDWIARLRDIRPESVQIYTVDRPTDSDNVFAVTKERLEEIAVKVEDKTGIMCEVYE